MKLSSSRIVGAVVAVAAAAALVIVGCATPSRIGPGQLPGVTTPEVTFHPPPGGLPTLPSGFHPCGEFTAPVTFNDGSTITLHGCLYCADNPNDPTVYIQHNCKGNYLKGIRNVAQDSPPTMPTEKKISSVSGSLGIDSSALTFTVDDPFDVSPLMESLKDQFLIDGLTATEWVEANATTEVPAGAQVQVSGDNASIADVLFWSFGSVELEGVTQTGDKVLLRVGFSPVLGVVVVPSVGGTVYTTYAGALPWRTN